MTNKSAVQHVVCSTKLVQNCIFLLRAVQNCDHGLRRGHHGPICGASFSCTSCQQLRCPATPESDRRSMMLLGSGVLLSSARITSCNTNKPVGACRSFGAVKIPQPRKIGRPLAVGVLPRQTHLGDMGEDSLHCCNLVSADAVRAGRVGLQPGLQPLHRTAGQETGPDAPATWPSRLQVCTMTRDILHIMLLLRCQAALCTSALASAIPTLRETISVPVQKTIIGGAYPVVTLAVSCLLSEPPLLEAGHSLGPDSAEGAGRCELLGAASRLRLTVRGMFASASKAGEAEGLVSCNRKGIEWVQTMRLSGCNRATRRPPRDQFGLLLRRKQGEIGTLGRSATLSARIVVQSHSSRSLNQSKAKGSAPESLCRWQPDCCWPGCPGCHQAAARAPPRTASCRSRCCSAVGSLQSSGFLAAAGGPAAGALCLGWALPGRVAAAWLAGSAPSPPAGSPPLPSSACRTIQLRVKSEEFVLWLY